jgi:S1-C subfamily serine protease
VLPSSVTPTSARAWFPGGPVATLNSPDGSEHLIQIGAFVNPSNKGTHTVTISGVLDGDATLAAFGGPFAGSITYTVIVK